MRSRTPSASLELINDLVQEKRQQLREALILRDDPQLQALIEQLKEV